MSEYLCSKGHLMLPKDGTRCKKCGGRVYTEDGFTDREIKGMEEAEEAEERDEENNEEDK